MRNPPPGERDAPIGADFRKNGGKKTKKETRESLV
jgi:hypothetical protein